MNQVQAARAELKTLYESDVDESQKRQSKQKILYGLRESALAEVEASGRVSPGWLRSPLNNASLIPLSLYQGRLDEFRELQKQCKGDLHCFYDKARELANL